MSDLDFLRGRIAGYADYADPAARHQVDQQVRAYLGEALSEARERLQPTGALAERLDSLLLRCEFSDQRAIRAADRAAYDRVLIDRMHALDRELVRLADAARAAAEDGALSGLIAESDRVLDERFGALAAVPGS